MTLFPKLNAKRAYRKIKKQAAKTGDMVCATLGPDGKTPTYFTTPKLATESDLVQAAFLARNGRPMDEFEKVLLAKAEERSRDGYL